jgi:hypothetical protein
MAELGQLVSQFGLPTALVIYFLWRSFVRERALDRRLFEVEKYQRETLSKLLVQTNHALNNNSGTMVRICELLTHRPCLHADADWILKNVPEQQSANDS